jgi:hypothetical protein
MDPYSPPLYAADRFGLVSWLALLSLLVSLIISEVKGSGLIIDMSSFHVLEPLLMEW